MTQTPQHEIRETATLRFARFVTRNRAPIGLLLILATLFFLYPIVNMITTAAGYPFPGPIVRVEASQRSLFPEHPFIHAQDEFTGRFGSSSLVAVAITVKDGTIFTPDVLQKIDRITKALDGIGYDSHTQERTELRDRLESEGVLSNEKIALALDERYPPYPVNHDQLSSVSARSTREVQIEADGSMASDLLMKEVPETQEDAEKLREIVRRNPPYIYGRLVSMDEKGALITAGFVDHRFNRSVYEAVFKHVQGIKQREETDNIKIYVSGTPILTGWVLKHAREMVLYTVATIIMIFALLLAYFRRLHGVLIPMIAAVVTVIWGLGFTGYMKIAFDPLVLVIPMIITARAVSHTVQMAERFFEDYELLLPRYGDPDLAKVEAATVAMGEVFIPGTLGVLVDVGGLLVILVTSIPQMRDLAIFGAWWVFSILFTVELLHPIMICYLPAPHKAEHFLPATMIRIMRVIGIACTHPTWKYVIGATTVIIFATSTYITIVHSKIGEASPGTPLLWPNHEFNVATAEIVNRFGGVDSMVVYVNGDRADASGNSELLEKMELFERGMRSETPLSASVSLVPFLKGAWQLAHYSDPKWSFIPHDTPIVHGMIFQLQMNGPPGFLRPYLSDDRKDANLTFVYRDHKGDTIQHVVKEAEAFIAANPMGEVSVRLTKDKAAAGASIFNSQNLIDWFYYLFDPLLPSRAHTLNVRVRDGEGYKPVAVNNVKEAGLPTWIDEFRDATLSNYVTKKSSLRTGQIFTWPTDLASWKNGDVDQWWESEELGIRAVGVKTKDLVVQDMKSVDKIPEYQPTQSWTRGVQFVMAGGVMGVLAAINDEVERSHVANISLIFLVIFLLHSLTYQSVASGGIIFLQIATATLFSLAYMALRGIGLNINTLPVQSVGVGIGVDYAIYIVDRIRQEVAETADIDEAVRRAIRSTGMAVSFTATTVAGGIILWSFSNLRFQAEMAQLLVILMIINMLGAITIVPTFYSILRPKVASALLTEAQRVAIRARPAAKDVFLP